MNKQALRRILASEGLLSKQARRHTYSMGIIRDGYEGFWPEPREWGVDDLKRDRFGDAYEMEYGWEGSPFMSLSVRFYAKPLLASDGKRPGTFKATFGFAKEYTGQWKEEKNGVLNALDEVEKWGRSTLSEIKKSIEGLSDQDWLVDYDGYQIDATYRGERTDFSDSDMTVTFRDVEQALIMGQSQEAEIHFIEGSDYEGHYGEKEVERSYSSLADIRNILGEAKTMFKRWDAE